MAEAAPLVTVVIPVFNGANYVAEAIDSALAQTWPHVEVLVVDDGSNDGGATQAVLTRFGERIRLLGKENGGVASALNLAISQMRGEYFSWLSHDDLFEPNKIELQMRLLLDFGRPAIAFSDTTLIDGDGNVTGRHSVVQDDYRTYPLWAVFEGRISGCTVVVPRECLATCGAFLESLPTTQDYELWYRLACHYPFLHLPEPLVRQRLHAAQGSRLSRHLDEASLLWMDMLDRTSPTVMCRYAGSERAFIERIQRFLKVTAYDAAVVGVEQLLADLTIRRGRPYAPSARVP